jgi:hypothetical protein
MTKDHKAVAKPVLYSYFCNLAVFKSFFAAFSHFSRFVIFINFPFSTILVSVCLFPKSILFVLKLGNCLNFRVKGGNST